MYLLIQNLNFNLSFARIGYLLYYYYYYYYYCNWVFTHWQWSLHCYKEHKENKLLRTRNSLQLKTHTVIEINTLQRYSHITPTISQHCYSVPQFHLSILSAYTHLSHSAIFLKLEVFRNIWYINGIMCHLSYPNWLFCWVTAPCPAVTTGYVGGPLCIEGTINNAWMCPWF
jgi:hypothetical protein